MCGIVGYIGQTKKIVPSLIKSLEHMEYRGYDSAGLAIKNSASGLVELIKARGEIKILKANCQDKLGMLSSIGIGHTRWATHGEATEINAHPHTDCQRKIYVVHNGTIDNFRNLKQALLSEGHRFISETDTEVIPHLLEKFLSHDENSEAGLIKAFQKTLQALKGTYGLIVMHQDFPNLLLTAKLGSPVLIGQGHNEVVIASDPRAIANYATRFVYLDDNEMAIVRGNDFEVFDAHNQLVTKDLEDLEFSLDDLEKDGYEDFMLKEICGQAITVADSFSGRFLADETNVKLGGLEPSLALLRKAKRIVLVGCGTSFYAAKVGEYLFEEIVGLPTKCEKGSEFACREPVFDEDSVYFFLSQSGETMDTLEALKKVKAKGLPTFGIVNAVGSTIARESAAGVYCRVGPEIAVASTKAFTSQIVILYLIAIMLGRQRGLNRKTAHEMIGDLKKLPNLIEKVLAQKEQLIDIAKDIVKANHVVFLGRKNNYPVALEGALKLKEIAYIATEGFPSGEMKHGPIALVDQDLPAVFIATNDSVRSLNVSNMQEIKSRQGKILAIATEGDQEIMELADWFFPMPEVSESLAPILNTIPLQLLAYYTAKLKGRNVDKPRNLAKAVVVR